MLTILTNIGSTKVLCLAEDGFWWGGRGPSVEDDLQRKTTFSGRQPSVEDNLWWKTTFGGRRPSVEDNLLLEDDLW